MASPGGTFWFRKRKSEGVKKSDQKINFSNVLNFFPVRDNELIFFTGQQ